MSYTIVFRAVGAQRADYLFDLDVHLVYRHGCALLRKGAEVLAINRSDPVSEPQLTVDYLRGAIASQDFYKREYARIGIDYPSMRRLKTPRRRRSRRETRLIAVSPRR